MVACEPVYSHLCACLHLGTCQERGCWGWCTSLQVFNKPELRHPNDHVPSNPALGNLLADLMMPLVLKTVLQLGPASRAGQPPSLGWLGLGKQPRRNVSENGTVLP